MYVTQLSLWGPSVTTGTPVTKEEPGRDRYAIMDAVLYEPTPGWMASQG